VPLESKLEGLGQRIKMMEMESLHAPAIAAESTASPRLLDKRLLHQPAPFRDRLHPLLASNPYFFNQ
jgi:hypothetical protein